MKKICVVGGGRFGINHIKTLYEMGNLAGIVEINSERLNELLSEYPVKGYSDLQFALDDGFDGFVVATPAPTHYALGKQIIEADYPVLIEKPMTLKASESLELVELAKEKKVNLMVGHLLLFHPAIRKIKEEIDEDLIGDIRYIYSTR
ncbi:MAG TPA: Gfo/Idh/MocA family oxidoreductase, partial [Clostridia bacterium]|nr:Gfo/Idh/MocA family oxidoreductase [Clostridia bacterium]